MSFSVAGFVRTTLPGLALAVAIAAVATVIGHLVPVIGAAVPAIVIGVVIALVRRPGAVLAPGLKFASKLVLQSAVVLLGTQLSLAEVASVGVQSFPVMISTLLVCLVAAWFLGRALRIDAELTTLIGVGTAICGASAIAAVSPVIRARNESIAYAVSTIFLFNVLAVLLFPPLGHALGFSQHEFGLFAGTAVNDTSSVVATAGIYGAAALSFAVVVKLVRTLMIIPISIGLALRTARRDGSGGPLTLRGVVGLVPWFLIGFLVASLIRSLGWIPDAALAPISVVSMFFIATAMAAIGLSTDLAGFRRAGVRPLLLGGILWLVVTATAITAILLTRA
ncbi:YeiH family protein [Microbacterium gorillae]|uniref:YeiH family protein n=1 Tax=Microbacterium gorillae TaxID=1231063 RepID=UPI00058EE12A|nr:putative sulfate exporter family transporter [Microbacterium gorillae]